jgi:quercetin dioxygenase-like cupin family protein
MVFYHAEDARPLDAETMPPGKIDKAVFAELDISPVGAGSTTTVLFKGDGPNGFSLVHADFKPGYRLPRHTHSADCLYYVLSGEIHMGGRVLKAGEGFFIKADSAYAYSAGPEGVQVLEFRVATSFDIQILDQTADRWKPIVAAALANRERWLAAEPAS